MTLTAQQLRIAMPGATVPNIDKYLTWLNSVMPRYGIDTPLRVAHFLAQIGHESGSFRYVEEIASGQAYEGRKDLGNTQEGDGVRFKGRGLIQITGRANYAEISNDLGQDFVSVPTLLSIPSYAVESACWFWKKRKLNQWADADDIVAITKRINGGLNGLSSRETLLYNAKRAVGL